MGSPAVEAPGSGLGSGLFPDHSLGVLTHERRQAKEQGAEAVVLLGKASRAAPLTSPVYEQVLPHQGPGPTACSLGSLRRTLQ